ncbi:MAG: nicotinate-nucleotide diphosphorylase (carboxylating), partial [Dehalococcoidia bacterium]
MTAAEALSGGPEGELRHLAESALNEDRARDDVTTAALVSEEQGGRAVIVAKAPGVLAGLPMAEAVFSVADGSLVWRPHRRDGDRLSAGDGVATVEGSLAAILRGERVALNYLSHLSGVATATAAVVVALQGTDCRLRDTRKTVPGLRSLEKYAVRMGGGTNHRLNLADGVLIKDNHLAALRARGL